MAACDVYETVQYASPPMAAPLPSPLPAAPRPVTLVNVLDMEQHAANFSPEDVESGL